jgi:putative exporter of polyketide antibiotics
LLAALRRGNGVDLDRLDAFYWAMHTHFSFLIYIIHIIYIVIHIHVVVFVINFGLLERPCNFVPV